MNYIKQLEQERADLHEAILSRAERMQEFREYLLSPKFHPIQQDGSRGDWISTADALNWLRYIEDPTQ